MSSSKELELRAPEAAFLALLFEKLANAGMDYCVMRNFESLPASLNGSDLDLLVYPECRDELAKVVIEAARSCGGRLISEYITAGRYMKFLGCHDNKWWGAAIDLMPGLDYRGVVYLDASPIIHRAEDYNGIKVCAPYDIDMMALIKELLNNGKTRRNYLPAAVSAFESYGEDALLTAKEAFGSEWAQDFGTWLSLTKGDSVDVKSMAHKMRLAVKKKHQSAQKGSFWVNLAKRMGRLWSPPGMVIAVTGTDGAGKTTVIDKITPVLEKATHGKINYEHLRPNWLPALGVAVGKRTAAQEGPVTDPHGKKSSGIVGSIVRLLYYWCDYVLGYYKKTYPIIVRKSHICLFDRYYYDIVIDPRRMRMSLSRWVMKLTYSLTPKPSLVVCLGADPETLYTRKPETSIDEVNRQVTEYRRLAMEDSRAVWIDTAQDIDGTVDDVLRAIQITMANRYE